MFSLLGRILVCFGVPDQGKARRALRCDHDDAASASPREGFLTLRQAMGLVMFF